MTHGWGVPPGGYEHEESRPLAEQGGPSRKERRVEGRELQALLAWSSLPFVGEAMLLSLLKRSAEGRQSLSALWEAPEEELPAFLRLHPKALAELRENGPDRWQQAALDAAEISGRGVDILVPMEPDCPPAL